MSFIPKLCTNAVISEFLQDFTADLRDEMQPMWERVNSVVTPLEWPFVAPRIKAINDLKKARNAVILAHNYMTPDIFHCVSDIRGDSLQLAVEASQSEADIIIQAGVFFMAETSKLLCPEKTVLIPDVEAGCSLASSITAEDVREMRRKYPGVPVVTYVNTTAAVKAETDICCTSSNVIDIVEGLGVPRVMLLPDEYLASYVQSLTDVEIIPWPGRCEVHEQYRAEDLVNYRQSDPSVAIVAHPECPPDVIAEADFTGSTSKMISYVEDNKPEKVFLITECSMASNISAQLPEVEFVKPCNVCPHMKRITLDNILISLANMTTEVTLDPQTADKARRAIERMIEAGTPKLTPEVPLRQAMNA
ncbi:MAG: quinolinate synthase NadA [Pseudomonadota bacterium]